MDVPWSGNPTIHKIEFSLMGVLADLPGFKHGDWVQYGGMIYKPNEETTNEALFGGNNYVFDGTVESWVDKSKTSWPLGKKHFAAVSKGRFWCS
jgi:hypothetical protein